MRCRKHSVALRMAQGHDTFLLYTMYGVKCGQGHFLMLVCTMCLAYNILYFNLSCTSMTFELNTFASTINTATTVLRLLLQLL